MFGTTKTISMKLFDVSSISIPRGFVMVFHIDAVLMISIPTNLMVITYAKSNVVEMDYKVANKI